ncbi:hypothetical protein Tco_0923413 [Tanacetum coccineum]|uniref:Uncharacterized protein n=1 Tax=Tanacetum coccineum TaxID=301880 RepID=A0ABQ5D833_9ASTR
MAFLADNGDTVTTSQQSQEIPTPAVFQTDDLDAFDSNCDEAPSASAYSEQHVFNNDTYIDISNDSNMISYEQYLKETKTMVVQDTSSSAQQNELIMFVIEEVTNQVDKCNEVDKENKIDGQLRKAKEDKYVDAIIELEKQNKALDNVIYKMVQSMQTMHMLIKPQAFYDESHKTALGYQNPLYMSQAQRKETLKLAEESRLKMHDKQNDPVVQENKVFWLPISKPVSKIPTVQPEPVLKEIPRELPTISLVKDSFNKIRSHVNDSKNVVSVSTKITGQNEGSWGFEHIRKAFEKDVKPFVKTLKEYFHMFDHGLHKEITNMKEVLTQMETEAAKCSIERKTFETKEKELLIENDRLLELIISQDLVHTAVNTLTAIVDYKKMEQSYMDEYNECLELKTELLKKNDMMDKAIYNKLSKRWMYKLDLEPLSPMLLRNREAHVDYLKNNQEHADYLYDIVEHARYLRPLDSDLDYAFLEYVNDVNVRAKPKSIKSKVKKVWQSTRKVYTNVGYSWKLTRTFTIDGSTCILTRITSTTVVPPKKPISSKMSGKLKDITNIGSSSKSKNGESKISNNSEPNKNYESKVSTAPSSSRVHFR